MQPSRVFTPYEKNFLRRSRINPASIPADDQTPVEYLAGVVNFLGYQFTITPDVLIPRVETEELVTLALKTLTTVSEQIKVKSNKKVRIADVGTGSGVIAISLALALLKRSQPYTIISGDIAPTALNIAQKNKRQLLSSRQLHKNNSKLLLIESDLLTNFPRSKFDLITANLPYIPTARLSRLDASVTKYEPQLALDGGTDGFSLIDKLLMQAADYLQPHGTLFLEVDHTHTEKFFAPYTDIWQIEMLTDSFERHRFVRLTKK